MKVFKDLISRHL